ncbi:hypothetical protein FV232_25015 [Methylobacterium sp. WL30]|uniref:hypothetical protein n=1 Tax=unclassified Methylobacterium TaxID=2615210 RepID=UPI0011CC0270|nr:MULTISPECIES: hypothetical protein [unclassified Methylobacterium]TXN29608.1 hypothetical protein FV225_20550 [Methylobacterium sp. WL93]TXN44262.1 hypothetical protein FV227_26910 [Methylobacterium sp. WL119]TXN62646.1 hypothetical protein FV232_25015 [Methylobacterium sp. WL30]
MQNTARTLNFPEMVRFRAERGLSGAVAAAAQQSRTSPGEYLRRALRAQLNADGVKLPPFRSGDDGPGPAPSAPAMRQAA